MERRPQRAFLSLGSNAAGASGRLRRALSELAGLPATRLVRVSGLYRSSPVGRRGQPDFLNCAAELSTRLSPAGLLTELKRLEAEAGRKPGPRWGPRPLDLDILLYGDRRLRTRWLQIPHPRALRRRFVLEPLAELAPRLRWPGGPEVERALAGLKAPSQNVRFVGTLPRRTSRG